MSPDDGKPSPGSTAGTQPDMAFRIYDLATGDDDARLCRDIPDSQCREQPRAFLYQVISQALSKIGDGLADAKVVLPWLLGMVGAPVFLVGFLVPIRESLALLPQILVGGLIRRHPVRKGFWAGASLVEGLCVLSMGAVALAGLRGAPAGWLIIALLVLFSLARGVASIAAKDVLGKTVSKGRRGRVNGHSATAAGLVTGLAGLFLVLSPAETRPDWLLYLLLIAGGASWLAAAAVYRRLPEFPGATEGGRGLGDLLGDQIRLLLNDRELRRFILVRALMIATALISPVYVALAQRGDETDLAQLGGLVLAAGLAGAVSSAFWGGLSDRSSRVTMALAAGLSGGLAVLAMLILLAVPKLAENGLMLTALLFVQQVAHAGVRIGRKTHVVDLAGGERKAEYVALSNTAIGVLLLVMGGVAGALMSLGLETALLILGLIALLGAGLAMTMRDAQA